ncbi:MAG TPA: 30S ribosomal protein S20 [Pyrinomonadaceae bacterium]|jgi:small subunit ribosomal protein S20|nr:30S ribosomal protein S20 [Pyrinomonadaceae bacterium]
MPNHKSAEKRVRQTERRNEVNRRNRSRLRTEIKKLRTAITGKDTENSQTILPTTVSMIDKMVAKGVLHRNAAARYKSRLTKHVTNLSAK